MEPKWGALKEQTPQGLPSKSRLCYIYVGQPQAALALESCIQNVLTV